MDILHRLHEELAGEEFDYVSLINLLKDYSKPRDKISRYLKNQDIIRIKKGLYIFGERHRRGLVSLEVLANLIYGPSYISFEYALAYYGMIPEKVVEVTSVTTHKNKVFNTPLGIFTYKHIPLKKYQIGITQQHGGDNRYFLMASKEKALVDVIARQKKFKSEQELHDYLVNGLRIEEETLNQLNSKHLNAIAENYQELSVKQLINLIDKRKKYG